MSFKTGRKYFLTRVISIVALVTFLGASAWAVVPTRISFQGKLLDNNKNPRNGSFSMTFRICDTESGSCASPVWTETQGSVSVNNGVFSVELGSVTALTNSVFANDQRWLEVQVGAETLTPRERLVTSPYAFRASMAETVDNAAGQYVLNQNTLQSGATFYVSSGTVNGNFRVGGVITAGSGLNVITTASGLLDAPKLTGLVPNASIATSSITKQGNTFNGANQLVKLNSSAGMSLTGTLTFSGVTNDIVTAGSENLALMPGGTGKVGVGLTAPTAMLHVSSSNTSGLSNLLVLSTGTGAGQNVVTVSTAGNVVASGYVTSRNKYVQVYDSAGGTAIGTAGFTSIPWNTQTLVDSIFSHNVGINNTRVTVNQTGLYRIHYSASMNHIAGNNRTTGTHRCLVNGVTQATPSLSYSYHRQTSDADGTGTASFLIQLNAGDYFEIQSQSNNATLNTIANASWVQAEFVR